MLGFPAQSHNSLIRSNHLGWIDAGEVDYRSLEPDSAGRATLDKMKARFIKVQSRLTLLKQQASVASYEVRSKNFVLLLFGPPFELESFVFSSFCQTDQHSWPMGASGLHCARRLPDPYARRTLPGQNVTLAK